LIASGVELAEVSMLLGHSELRVTMDFYGAPAADGSESGAPDGCDSGLMSG
jgi:hypothetical protein